MNDAEKYLAQRTRVSTAVVLLENLAAVGLFLLMSMLVIVAVYGFQVDGLAAGHAMLCVAEVLLVIPLNLITERKRARKHAELIVDALAAQAEGRIPCDELEAVCGVRRAAQRAVQLSEKGYLTGIGLRKGYVCLMDRQAEEPEEAEDVKPIFHN